MSINEYKKHSGDWFYGKFGTTNKEIRNNGGGIIPKNDTIIFRGKSGHGGFNIRSVTNGVSISQVSYLSIDFDFKAGEK
jgi:hypothetical protein